MKSLDTSLDEKKEVVQDFKRSDSLVVRKTTLNSNEGEDEDKFDYWNGL